jgi:hypothetical protein
VATRPKLIKQGRGCRCLRVTRSIVDGPVWRMPVLSSCKGITEGEGPWP